MLSFFNAKYAFSKNRRTSGPSLFKLPDELLIKIASCIPGHHPYYGYPVESSNLASLSSVSRLMYIIVIPLLYRQIPITSERQLSLLCMASTKSLEFVQELNLFMDVEFLDAWERWTSAYCPYLYKHTSRLSIYHTFSRLLSAIPRVRCLRMRVSEISGVRSGWGKFACVDHGAPVGISMGGPLEEAFHVYKPAQLRELVNLEMDGFFDIWPLLKLAPSLETLKMCRSGGFPMYGNVELIQALRYVSTLKHLSYTPKTLFMNEWTYTAPGFFNELVVEEAEAMTAINGDGNDVWVLRADVLASLELVTLLGKVLPHLETLDLQTRHFWGEEISFFSAPELIPLKGLEETIMAMKNLRSIKLPSSVYPVDTSHGLDIPAMEHLTASEHHAVETLAVAMTRVSRPLSITFVRPTIPDELNNSSITYTISPSSQNVFSRIPCSTPASFVKTINNAPASFDQIAPWPHTPPISLSYTLRKLWLAPTYVRLDLAISFMKDQHVGIAHIIGRIEESWIGEGGWRLYQRRETLLYYAARAYDCAYGICYLASKLWGRIRTVSTGEP